MAIKSVRIALTREHRDAIYEEIKSVACLGSDLSMELADAEFDESGRESFRWTVRRLAIAERLFDQLGWQRRGDQDRYECDVDEDVAKFMEGLDRNSRGCLEGDRENMLDPRESLACYGVTYTDEEWAEELEWRRQLVDVIDAARIALDAFRKAVA